MDPPQHQKRHHFIRSVITQSPNTECFKSLHLGPSGKAIQWVEGEGNRPEDRPALKRECFKHTLPLIFKAESILNPRLSFPPSSQRCCLSLLPNAHKAVPDGNSQRPLPSHGGHSREGRGRNSRAQCSRAPRAPVRGAPGGLRAARLPPRPPAHMCRPSPLPQPLESLRGHLVIRCPSDVFTFFLTADTSGAHIQVIPVPLDTFHKIISAVVMAIFLPPVIFKLHDRNSWS